MKPSPAKNPRAAAKASAASAPPAPVTPLALVVNERVMPGGQLVNRLQDLGYRVQTLTSAAQLVETAEKEKPLLVFIDLAAPGDAPGGIKTLRTTPATEHLPVVAFGPDKQDQLLAAAETAGANLSVGDSAVVNHLPQLIERALHLE